MANQEVTNKANSKLDEKSKNESHGASLSRLKASFLFYGLTFVLIGFIVGSVLIGLNKIPITVVLTFGSIGTLITLISGFFGGVIAGTVLQGVIQIWKNANRPIATLASVVTIVLLTVPFLVVSYFSSDPYTHTGKFTFEDTLHNNGLHHNWQENTECMFKNSAYHASIDQNDSISLCSAQTTNFSTFVYQAQLTIVQGDCGGIIFRLNEADAHMYFFLICQGGFTGLSRYDTGGSVFGQMDAGKTLWEANLPAIIHPLHQLNTIAVVASDSSLDLWINGQVVESNPDTTYKGGNIGVAAFDIHNNTEVVFSDVKVWKLG